MSLSQEKWLESAICIDVKATECFSSVARCHAVVDGKCKCRLCLYVYPAFIRERVCYA